MTFLGNLVLLVSLPLVSGLCSKCREGQCYDTGECIAGCIQGYVGIYCDEDCPTRCVNNECYIDRIKGTVTCSDGCESGYCGTKCTYPCPDGCVTCDRECNSCNETLCPERRYGDDCSEICNPRYEKCDRESGQCIRCRRGYFGDECTRECKACFTREDDLIDACLSGCDKCQSKESCRAGFHGNSCELKCSSACDNPGGCNRGTGECSAGCESGYHGLACNYTCSEHCLNRKCDQTTGECSAGCESGYQGPTCRTIKNAVENDSSNNGVLAIVLPVVSLLVFLAVGCVLLVIFRRKLFLRRRRHDPESWELQELLMPAGLDGTGQFRQEKN